MVPCIDNFFDSMKGVTVFSMKNCRLLIAKLELKK
jgi:hypothetical protein